MSQFPELQDVVRSLRGVAHASVHWPEPGGPATLHIVFEEDADRDEATLGVVDALRRVGDVDLSTLRVQVPPPPGAPAPGSGGPWPVAPPPPQTGDAANGLGTGNGSVRAGVRPVFTGLSVDRSDLDNAVTVTLQVGDRMLKGRAEGLATRRETPRTAAAAVLIALREVLPRDARVQLEWLQVVEGSADRPATVQSAVTFLTASGEETQIGSAIVRGDLRESTVRATLDAVNRRLQRILAGGE